MAKFTSIDLFAGIGGIRLGFENAFGNDIKTVYASEWDEHAVKTYKANFDKDNFEVAGDITKIDEDDVPEFDICLAGFPCQSFSLAGQRKGLEDYTGKTRGTLFFHMARICKRYNPKVIFCENVKGFKMHDRGQTYNIIRDTLEEMGYAVFSKVLNSRDYGVPQNRERIYIVAFRNDIAPDDFNFPKPIDSSKRLKHIVEKELVSVKYYLSTTYLETLRKHKAYHASKGNGFGYEIRSNDDIAGAIVCGGMGRERNLLIDKRLTDFTPETHIKGEVNREGVRKMTPREWARLQGYPETFQFPVADVHAYKQLGNSVTVPVIEAIAKEIKSVLTIQVKKTGGGKMLTGNKGEWSEIYTLFKLLADGKLYAADENLNRMDDIYFPIIKIIREEVNEVRNEFCIGSNIDTNICIQAHDGSVIDIPAAEFSAQADYLFEQIQSAKGRAFPVPATEKFMDEICIERIKSLGQGKIDIFMEIHDIQTGHNPEVGFSIKSRLGGNATLLNASSPTNFIFEIIGKDKTIEHIKNNLTEIQGAEIPNALHKSDPIKDILTRIYDLGVRLKYHSTDIRLMNNLTLLDSEMPQIIAAMLEAYYSKKTKKANITEVIKCIANENVLESSHPNLVNYYSYKVRNLLCAVALGMTPTTEWNGADEATGGYIVVKSDGDVVTYHIYNRDKFKEYLFKYTKMEAPQRFDSLPPKTKKGFDYGYIYEEDDKLFIKLNLQIRFIR